MPSLTFNWVITEPPIELPALLVKNVVPPPLSVPLLDSKIPKSLGRTYVPGPGVPNEG